MPTPSWSLPVDCLGAFSFDPCAGVPGSVWMDVSPVFAAVGERGAGGASLGATDDVLLRGGMLVNVRGCNGRALRG